MWLIVSTASGPVYKCECLVCILKISQQRQSTRATLKLRLDQDLTALNGCAAVEQKDSSSFPRDIGWIRWICSKTSRIMLVNLKKKKLWSQQSYVVLMTLDWNRLLPLQNYKTQIWPINIFNTSVIISNCDINIKILRYN